MTYHLETEPIRLPEKSTPSAWVIFDLDGVLIRWPKYDLPNTQSQAHFFEKLQVLHDNNVGISVLTNRPPGAVQALAYQLGVNNGYWVTESGGSVYSIAEHKSHILPQWTEYAQTHVPEARSYLEDNIGLTGYSLPPFFDDEAQFEPGMGWIKTAIVPPKGIPPKEYLDKAILPIWSQYKNSPLFTYEVGKAIDINPRGLSKAEGMKSLLDLNNIDPKKTPTIFIADATRDIPAAETLMELGGFVGAVGNASSDFKDVVSKNTHGITAPASTNYHCSVVNILNYFLR